MQLKSLRKRQQNQIFKGEKLWNLENKLPGRQYRKEMHLDVKPCLGILRDSKVWIKIHESLPFCQWPNIPTSRDTYHPLYGGIAMFFSWLSSLLNAVRDTKTILKCHEFLPKLPFPSLLSKHAQPPKGQSLLKGRKYRVRLGAAL
jgi:hypothetical protein